MIQDMKAVFERVLTANESKLEECNGEPDHVHLLNQSGGRLEKLGASFAKHTRSVYP